MEDDDGRILDRDQKPLFLQVVINPQRYHRIDHELIRGYMYVNIYICIYIYIIVARGGMAIWD
jgi:hypothetical protein